MHQLEAHPLAVRERQVPDPAGTLVLLHGRATDENDLFGLFDVLDPDRRWRGLTIGGPLRLPPGGKHWYVIDRVGFPNPGTFHTTMSALDELLGNLDWSRTVVGGFSQGAVMSFALGLGAGRPLPAGIMGFSGFVPTVEGWAPDLATREGLPVFLAHGSLDPVISVEFAHRAKALLEGGGAALEYHETPMAHTIDPRVLPSAQAFLGRLAR